ncbi:restriction endonuclease subunit S [Vibrio cholerae]
MSEKQTVKFGDICREVKLTTKDPIADGYERYIGLEHLDSGSLKIKRWGIIAEDNPSFTRVFKKGHILFGKRRPYLKKAAIAEFDGICSGDIIVLEAANDCVMSSLASFIIQSDSFWENSIKTSSGSLSPRTKYSAIAKFELTQLSLGEVDYSLNLLNVALKTIRSCEVAVESVDHLFRKMLTRYFIDEDSDKKLSDFCEVKSGQHIEAKLYHDDPSGTPYLTGPDDFPEGTVIVKKFTHSPKVMCKKGSTLLTVKGSGVGKTAFADGEYCISRQLMAISSSKISEQSVYLLISAMTEKLNQISSGVIPGITKKEVENFRVKDLENMADEVLDAFSYIIETKHTLEEKLSKSKSILRLLTSNLIGV